jgi:hypothetical protein
MGAGRSSLRHALWAMDIAAFVLSLIAIGISAVAAGYARRQALSSEDSAREITRSADAAQEVASYQRDDVEHSRVDFVLAHFGDAAHMLSHLGTDIAYGVNVDAGDLRVDGEMYDFKVFPPGHAEPIYLSRSMATVTSHVTVSWHQVPDLSDEKRTRYLYVNR